MVTVNDNSFLASDNIYCLLMTFANSLDPDQNRQSVGSDLDTDSVPEVPEVIFFRFFFFFFFLGGGGGILQTTTKACRDKLETYCFQTEDCNQSHI